MNPRLIILIVLAAGMAIYFAAIRGGPKVTGPIGATTLTPEEERVKEAQTTIGDRELPGSEPPEKPNLSVQVEVDRSKGKNRLNFTISEAHGYYVEQFRVHFWYVRPGQTGPEGSPVNITQFFDRYLPANSTIRACMELVPAELKAINGDMGETKDWDAEIVWHGRARAKNPDPLPSRTDIVDCD